MKKQLLIAAVAATMASVSMADVSISGGATANINSVSGADTTYASDIDLKIVGKAGATTATVDLEFLTSSEGTVTTATDTNATAGSLTNFVKNAYISTNIAGANIKVGDWYGSDSLLGNGTNDNTEGLSVDYTMSGVKVQYEAQGASDSVTVSGTVGGVAISHEIFDDSTDTKFSGSAAGVAITYRKMDNDTDSKDASSLEVSTAVSGVTVSYAKVDRNAAGNSDAFFGEFAGDNKFTDATGFALSTSVAGNKVTFKSLDIDNVDTNKVIVSRPLAGGTFEATFADKDGAASSVDLELKVSF
jgi:hypothetical protein